MEPLRFGQPAVTAGFVPAVTAGENRGVQPASGLVGDILELTAKTAEDLQGLKYPPEPVPDHGRIEGDQRREFLDRRRRGPDSALVS